MEPLVSVVIPSYNRASVLEASVRSVLNQSYRNLELIVVDDGSKDNTREVLEAIGDERVRYVYQDNAGACAARNHGVSEAKADYIAFHDSDDIWHADKLEKQMAAMAEHGADVVICRQYQIHPDGTSHLAPKRIGEGFLDAEADLFGIGTQAILARRYVLEAERFDVQMPRLQDLEWLYRVRKRFRVYCMAEGLVDYYVSGDSITRSHEKRYQALSRLLGKNPELRRTQPFLAMHAIRDLLESWRAVRKEDPAQSGKYLKLGLRYYPGALRFAAAAVRQRRLRDRGR